MQKFTDFEKEKLKVILEDLKGIFNARSVGVALDIDNPPIYPLSEYDYKITLSCSDKEF